MIPSEIPLAWSRQFGLALGPLFETGEVENPDEHHVRSTVVVEPLHCLPRIKSFGAIQLWRRGFGPAIFRIM
jgi:hypothetical protein